MQCLKRNVYSFSNDTKRFYPIEKFKKLFGYNDSTLINENGTWFQLINCGYCFNCFMNKRGILIQRIKNEAEKWKFCVMFTLTYDNKHLPSDGLVDLKHIQNFVKYLRKLLGSTNFKWCASSEYGELFDRPHYHGLLFFNDDLINKFQFKRLPGKNDYYTSFLISKAWKFRGFTTSIFGSNAIFNYVAKYSLKNNINYEQKQFYFRLWKYRYKLYCDNNNSGSFLNYVKIDEFINANIKLLKKGKLFIKYSKKLGYLNSLDLNCENDFKRLYGYQLKKYINMDKNYELPEWKYDLLTLWSDQNKIYYSKRVRLHDNCDFKHLKSSVIKNPL